MQLAKKRWTFVIIKILNYKKPLKIESSDFRNALSPQIIFIPPPKIFLITHYFSAAGKSTMKEIALDVEGGRR